jgi:hypothetical protein
VHLISLPFLEEIFMPRQDIQILFTALGFLTVVMKGENAKKDGAKQAKAMAGLIEAFCQAAHPKAFEGETEADKSDVDQIIEDYKEDEFPLGRLATLIANKELLYRVYDRLVQRHRAYASEEMIAGEIEHFLEEELRHNKKAKNDDRQRSGG